jgi:hypothetical protein
MNHHLLIIAKHLTILCLIMSFHKLPAQETNNNSKHSVNIEILGRTIIWSSVNYEYKIMNNLSIGSGLGFTNSLKGDIIRDNNGIPETGRYLDIGTTQMIYGNYFIGKPKHQFFFTGGLTHFLMVYKRKYPSETEYSAESQIKWNVGMGYQLSGKQTYFRFTAYCIRMPDPSGWFPEIIPWAGVSMGIKL